MYNPGLGKVSVSKRDIWLRQIWAKARELATVANIVGLIGAIIALFCLFKLPDSQYLNIRLPLYLIVAVWTIVRPRVALYLIPFAIPWGSLDTGSGLTPKGYDADILIGLLAAGWLMGFTLRPLASIDTKHIGPLDRDHLKIPHSLIIASILLLLTMLLSVTVTTSLSLSAKEVTKWLEVLVIILIGSQYIRTRRQLWTIVLMICLATISQGLLGYAQVFFNLGPASFVRGESLRVYGTLGQPNPYAGYINMTLTITLSLLLLGRNLAMRIIAGGASLLLLGVEFYSQSKGGWLALAIALLFILIVGFPRLRAFFSICAIALLVGVELFLNNRIPSRIFEPVLLKIGLVNISFTSPTTASYANSERVAHWIAGIHMFQDHPLLGVGIGNYGTAYAHYAPGIFVIPLGHAHNYYINIAAEAGIFGLLAFLLFLCALLVTAGRALRHINKTYQRAQQQIMRPVSQITTIEIKSSLRRLSILKNDRALAIGLFAAILSVLVHNLVDNLYVHGMTGLFALLLVLLIRLDGMT